MDYSLVVDAGDLGEAGGEGGQGAEQEDVGIFVVVGYGNYFLQVFRKVVTDFVGESREFFFEFGDYHIISFIKFIR